MTTPHEDQVSVSVEEAVNQLVDEYRHRCLWFLREDFYPVNDAERRRALDYIQRHGDQAAFRRVAELRRWLSQDSSARFVGSYVEAEVSRGRDTVLVQWTRDSAFRFFPLVEHADLGLTLHPFDRATNKLLALVGRLEPRDWVDVVECHDRLQPLGYLAWAASGKDPGFSPAAILEEAARTARYSRRGTQRAGLHGRPTRRLSADRALARRAEGGHRYRGHPSG